MSDEFGRTSAEVPVYLPGPESGRQAVGVALVNDDGTMDVTLDKDSEAGKRLINIINEGTLLSVSLGYVPARQEQGPPREVPSKLTFVQPPANPHIKPFH